MEEFVNVSETTSISSMVENFTDYTTTSEKLEESFLLSEHVEPSGYFNYDVANGSSTEAVADLFSSNLSSPSTDSIFNLATAAVEQFVHKTVSPDHTTPNVVQRITTNASSTLFTYPSTEVVQNPAITNVSSLYCLSTGIPPAKEYLAAIDLVGQLVIILGAFVVFYIIYTYAVTLKHVISYVKPLAKTHTVFVLSVYPVVAIATYCALIVPRAHLLAEAITQGMFMASMYQLFCLLVAYCGGEAELVRKVKPDSLNLQVSPCCCCCLCLPFLPLNKEYVKLLRLLVLQLPVVQGLVYMVLLVMWAEEESLYQVNYMYVQPLVICSILCGIWAMVITMTMLEEPLKDYQIKGKFFALQLVLLLAKLQGLLAKIAVWTNILPCNEPMTPTVYANMIYNTAMLCEILILATVAKKLYKLPVPENYQVSPKHKSSISHICQVLPCSHRGNFVLNNNNNNNNINNSNPTTVRF